jgi:hypothetical protein
MDWRSNGQDKRVAIDLRSLGHGSMDRVELLHLSSTPNLSRLPQQSYLYLLLSNSYFCFQFRDIKRGMTVAASPFASHLCIS